MKSKKLYKTKKSINPLIIKGFCGFLLLVLCIISTGCRKNENLLLKAESETRLQKLKLNKTIAIALVVGLGLPGLIIFLLY